MRVLPPAAQEDPFVIQKPSHVHTSDKIHVMHSKMVSCYITGVSNLHKEAFARLRLHSTVVSIILSTSWCSESNLDFRQKYLGSYVLKQTLKSAAPVLGLKRKESRISRRVKDLVYSQIQIKLKQCITMWYIRRTGQTCIAEMIHSSH